MDIFSSLFVMVAVVLGPAVPRVYVDHGNIVLSETSGSVRILTATGRDFDPVLTAEGDAVLFVRSDATNMFRTSIYEFSLMSRTERLLFQGPLYSRGYEISYLGEPAFDRDRRTLYVLGKTGVTAGELYQVDLSTGKDRFIASAASYVLIKSGPHAGEILVYQRKVGLDSSIYYVYWLYSSSGGDLGIAGPDDLDVARASDPDGVLKE